jgi:hypothetical protein
MHRRLPFLLISVLLATGMLTRAEEPASGVQASTGEVVRVTDQPAAANDYCEDPATIGIHLEQCKFRLEQQKYSLEARKRRDEQAAMYAAVAAVLVSALVGFGTIIFNLILSNRQGRLQTKLKALEVVISAAGPKSAKERLDVVSQMLGDDWIPEARKEDLTIKGIGVGHDESRRTLLKLLAEYPDKREEMLADWATVFGDGSLGPHISALQHPKNSASVAPLVDPSAGAIEEASP